MNTGKMKKCNKRLLKYFTLINNSNYHIAKRFLEKKKSINKKTGLSRSINIRYQQNIDVSIML